MISNVSLANSALIDLKRRADAGDAIAQNNLGHFYLYGNEEYPVLSSQRCTFLRK